MRKKILLSSLVLVLLVAGGAWWAFNYYTHRDVSTADIGVEDNFFDFDEFIIDDELLAEGDGAPATEDVETLASSISGEADPKTTPAEPSTEKKADAKQEPKTPAANAGKDSTAALEKKYDKIFAKLQEAALARLDTLANNALKDYKEGRSLRDVSSTYMSAANKLQDKVDSAFYIALNRMKKELDSKGLDHSLAKKAEGAYNKAIEKKKSDLTSKMLKIVN